MSNQENEPSKLPPAPLVQPDITAGQTPLPPTSLLTPEEFAARNAATGPDPSDKEEDITTFEDGSVFKYMPRPTAPGHVTSQCIVVEATGKQIAIAKDANLAEFICNACNMFVLAQLKHEADGTQLQTFAKPIIFPGR